MTHGQGMVYCLSGHTLPTCSPWQVHQPRQSIWSLFNKVMLLSEGRLLYHGLVPEVICPASSQAHLSIVQGATRVGEKTLARLFHDASLHAALPA